MTQDMLIYEFEENYFLIQRGQQGKPPVPQTSHQRPSEDTGLFSKLPFSCTPYQLGKAAIETLDNFDTVPPQYDPWENKELNKQLCGWLETRYFATITKNSRLVQLRREGNIISIYPFDNHNKQPWYGPMIKDCGFRKEVFFTTSSDSSPETIGKLILEAFAKATYNPERKKK